MKKTATALTMAGALGITLLTACSGDDSEGAAPATVAADSVDDARGQNRERKVDSRFGDGPTVLADASGTGAEASRTFFEESETAVITAADDAAALRGASLAVAVHAPALRVVDGDSVAEVREELQRLGTKTVLLVGDVPAGVTDGLEGLTTVAGPVSTEAASEMTSLDVDEKEIDDPEERVRAVAELDGDATLLRAAFPDTRGAAPTEAGAMADEAADIEAAESGDGEQASPEAEEPAATESDPAEVESFPVQEAHDGGSAPVVIAAPSSPLMSVATARAYGATVRFMAYPDPRVSEEATYATAGLEDRPVIGLGQGFGKDGEELAARIALSQEDTPELPGGGHLLFPGRRMVALYGHPTGGALGVMGEKDPAGSVEYAKELVGRYEKLDDEEPVIPAFEIITTVASEFPGEDGDYSNEAEPEEILPYIDAITEAGGYAVLDLQPGRARFIDQAKRYEEILKRPDVGLALDPEWRIGPDELPLERVGSVEAEEVNEVSEWLANLVRENDLPQKAFVLHQFQVQMLRDREQIRTDHPELSYVLHADGHGTPDLKFETWDVIRQGLDPNFFMAWKNFIDEDNPTFTPEQTFEVDPRPWFISYQ